MCVVNACAARSWARVISHTCAWPTQRTRDQCLHTHMCVAQARSPWSRFRLPDCTRCFCYDVRVCDFTQMCVADACRNVCSGRGRCGDLAACRFFVTWLSFLRDLAACHISQTQANAHTCLHRKQRTQAMVSDYTHMCVAEARGSWSRLQLPGLFSACARMQPRCRRRCFCDVCTFVVVQR